MDAQRQGFKVQTVITRDDNLTVQDAPLWELPKKWVAELRKVAIKRLAIAALDEQFVASSKDHRAKAVPFRLKDPFLCIRRDLTHPFGEHRQDRRR
jgi:hypothetical protein